LGRKGTNICNSIDTSDIGRTLSSPALFNEKICNFKLYGRGEFATRLQDKWLAREHVAETVGKEVLTRVFWYGEFLRDIPLEDLPASFVVKTTDGAGGTGVVLVEDKEEMSAEKLRGRLEGLGMTTDRYGKAFHYYTNEWWYAKIPRRLMVEEFVRGKDGGAPIDYKCFVFHGKVVFVQADLGRFVRHRRSLYTPEWDRLDIEYNYPSGEDVDTPPDLKRMIGVAEALGDGVPFLRVDLFNPRPGRIVFCEFTIAPSLGHGPFRPQSFDFELGRRW
jgi:hypothetical protein